MKVIEGLLAALNSPSPFQKTQYPYPLNQSLFGKFDLAELRHRAENVDKKDLTAYLPVVLALAEAVEASQPDRDKLFMRDREARARLNMLNRDVGWALLWGTGSPETAKLMGLLRQEYFQVFTIAPRKVEMPRGYAVDDSPRGVGAVSSYLGARPTAVVYFAQTLVRYPHIYGRVPLGDDHAVTDFLCDHGPGVIILNKQRLTALEKDLLLGLLLLGIPAVVPPALATPYGLTQVADEPEAMVKAAVSFPNMKTGRNFRFEVKLPFNFDFFYSLEKIKDGHATGETPLSSFIVTNEDKGDGVEVIGKMAPDVAIEVSIGSPRVDITMTDYLEEIAAELPSYVQGVSSQFKDGTLRIGWRPGMALQPEHIGQALYQGLKAEFKVEPIKVRLVFDKDLLPAMKEAAAAFRQLRKDAIASSSEEKEPFFYACKRCHSFALEHCCIVTPDRPPQCGKTWTHIKTRAYLTGITSSGQLGLRVLTPPDTPEVKGQVLDAVKGEYEGINQVVEGYTEGRTKRIYLHSIFGYPHTACSCFGAVAFHIPEVDGIGLIERGYSGTTPDGRNWDEIANSVAGKQSSGYMSMGRSYLASTKFLQGDGGWKRVVWMPGALKRQYAADKTWIATEKEATTLDELKLFLKQHGR